MTDRSSHRPRFPRLAIWLLCSSLFGGAVVHAQALRPSSGLRAPAASTPAASTSRTADFIVALVNSEPVTNNEVRQRMVRLEQQLTQQSAPVPPREQLARQVLEQIVSERAQVQLGTELGIRVDEASLAQAEQSIAAQNQLTPEEFRRRIAADGVDINQLRNDLRNQILLQRLREREVDSKVRVSEADIDDFIRERQGSNDVASLQLNLAQVFVAVPEDAAPDRVQTLQARAQSVADRARAGGDFAELAREFSEGPERANGGQFGMRQANRLPELFVDATRSLSAGGVAGPVRSPAGFHVLKVIEKRQAGLPDVAVSETRARHILLRLGPQLSEADAVARLAGYRQQIAAGQATFEALAREHSQDGSARDGGNLGWAQAGQFVPEFEAAMGRLRPGEMSLPVVSRFGVHLIRVDERRQSTLSARDQREMVRGLVREQKINEALRTWVQDVRGRAYVEYREAPQL
ncbi:peptidylprolyl isomerase [Hydrogenophaga sp. PBL-H3]|uniref:peptidylprolyl isomerase n=1 Tax=Hydrogenophaga sp. PBL-H3 TaxID=434010 RepID=UPI00131FAD04|nr:peptidylprolyl isomerase [Hydrogenophaga sp. PBL-H3]QHE78221.1 molecular chaperone SurA [Hydrogenophaga sp. PBL-H3]QHE82645.1 molecular chaperone SurA [Hydrogenophaga sp. PBL-H3]